LEALRSAIINDAADGVISSAGIMAALPVDFRLADNDSFAGKQNVCDPVPARTERQ
jgi:predicted aconitase with swiveling domain